MNDLETARQARTKDYFKMRTKLDRAKNRVEQLRTEVSLLKREVDHLEGLVALQGLTKGGKDESGS